MSTEKATDKIRAEMTSNANNGYVQVVGNFLLLHIEEHPEDAQHLVSPSKTILKSVDAMSKVAQKKRVGGVAVLTDPEGFAVVLDYFRAPEPSAKAEAPKQTESEENAAPKADKPKRERKPKPKPEPAPEPEDETGSDSDIDPDTDDEEEIDLDALLM